MTLIISIMFIAWIILPALFAIGALRALCRRNDPLPGGVEQPQ